MNANSCKVLVADDEYWIRENLRAILDWQEYSFDFMEPAIDGEDVLAKMEADCPDILITDINMPFINGVELTNIVKKRYPHVVVIALSGYSDYQYVRDSLLAGAIDYLLKPITKLDLINILAKALEVISRNKSMEHEREAIKEELLKASSILQDKELSMLIASEELSTGENTANDRMFEMKLEFISFSLVLIKLNKPGLMLDSKFKQNAALFSYSVKNKIKELAGSGRSIIFNNLYISNEFVLISDMENVHLDAVCEKLLTALSQLSGSTVSIAVSKHYFSLENVHMAYNEAVSALMCRKYRCCNSKIWLEDVKSLLVKKRMTPEDENKLLFAIQNKNRKLVKQLVFDQIGLQNCHLENWLFIEVRQTVDRIAGLLINNAVPGHSPFEIMALESLTELLDRKLESFDTAEVCSIMEQIIDESLGVVDNLSSNETIRHTVKLAAEYINENYFEDLSLTSLSKQFHVESSYLSRAFKKETGDNLMFYIAKRRVEKAVDLIEQGSLNLTEISYLVGYDDYTYFNRVFRKVTGKGPREYKSRQATAQEVV